MQSTPPTHCAMNYSQERRKQHWYIEGMLNLVALYHPLFNLRVWGGYICLVWEASCNVIDGTYGLLLFACFHYAAGFDHTVIAITIFDCGLFHKQIPSPTQDDNTKIPQQADKR